LNARSDRGNWKPVQAVVNDKLGDAAVVVLRERGEWPDKIVVRRPGGRSRAAASVRIEASIADPATSAALAERVGVEHPNSGFQLQVRAATVLDRLLFGRGGVLGFVAAVLTLLAGVGVAIVGFATNVLPTALNVVILVVGIVAPTVKAVADLRAA
jgi:hypothetical protein